MPGHGLQQSEFGHAQPHVLPVAQQAERRHIERERTEALHAVLARKVIARSSTFCRRPGARLRAAQQGAQPGQQFARAERLGQIVVGADFEADHPVDFLATRRQHQDGHIALPAQFTRESQSILPRQHQVEDHRLRLDLAEAFAHGIAVRSKVDTEAVAAQIVAQQRAQIGVVVDDQDAGVLRSGFFHDDKSRAIRRRAVRGDMQ
ncbi:hypothetical protein GALL_551850 [mine drainage metagenome]|uniref:Uncharacterized protein n=1 Tax=mine drainage metagenome TaxID=410659 RepID=A0A1J5PDG5_9ZZZZ